MLETNEILLILIVVSYLLTWYFMAKNSGKLEG